jgi:hypothetical protein
MADFEDCICLLNIENQELATDGKSNLYKYQIYLFKYNKIRPFPKSRIYFIQSFLALPHFLGISFSGFFQVSINMHDLFNKFLYSKI